MGPGSQVSVRLHPQTLLTGPEVEADPTLATQIFSLKILAWINAGQSELVCGTAALQAQE